MPATATIARCALAPSRTGTAVVMAMAGCTLRGQLAAVATAGTNGGGAMDQQQLLFALLLAAGTGLLALLLILRRSRLAREDSDRESPIAASREGVKLCPSCATENLWSDSQCVRCGRRLPDAQRSVW
ncbi:MAG: hypothetical protein MUC54_02690 [Chloroflexi bacterium]|nr:hypothetical protein [Chloroflexota bacterium]